MTCSELRFGYIFVGLSAVLCASVGGNAATSSETTGRAPPGSTTERTGGVHDFDYFAGAWATRQHRLKVRGTGGTEGEDFPATLCMTLYLGGMATVDELYMPTKDQAGLTLRTFDSQKHQWSIYWDNGRPVKVRFTWNKIDQNHARWEQAFSYDNRTWETNWTADFERADPTRTCENGRPRR
jgi:hypothetical protein